MASPPLVAWLWSAAAADGGASTLVVLGCLLLAGIAVDALGGRTGLPRVTLLLLLGIAVGPMGLDLGPETRSRLFPLLATVALSMIGFLLGSEFSRTALRERGRSVLVVSGAVTVVSLLVVGGGLVLLGVPAVLALLLGAVATATDPAATAAVVHETGARGPFSRLLLGIVAVDDVWGIAVFSVTLAVASVATGTGDAQALLLLGVREVGGGVLLGLALGLPMALLTGRLRPGEPTLLEALGFVVLCGGLASLLSVSYLLAAVTLGATVANVATHHELPFREIEHVEWPFLTLFFVLAGAELELTALSGAGLALAGYVALRLAARVIGALAGARLAGEAPRTGRWLGLALLPQAGVALGLALAVEAALPEVGRALLPVVLVSTVIFEVAGPLAARRALQAVGEAEGADPAA